MIFSEEPLCLRNQILMPGGGLEWTFLSSFSGYHVTASWPVRVRSGIWAETFRSEDPLTCCGCLTSRREPWCFRGGGGGTGAGRPSESGHLEEGRAERRRAGIPQARLTLEPRRVCRQTHSGSWQFCEPIKSFLSFS